MGEKVEVMEQKEGGGGEEEMVEAPVIPDYLKELVKLFDKDGDGLVNQSEVAAAKQFVSSEGLRELAALFDADGDGNIDVGEISAARKLVMSMKTSEQKMFVAEGLDKLDAIKRGEKLARLKAEEKREETMRKQHDGIQAKLKERKMKRRAAIDKMERAGKEEQLVKKSEGKVNLETIGLKSERVARETHKNIELGDLLGDDDEDWG